jgi:hypothetical protein
MVGHDLGGRPEACLARKNAKIPEVVKVNNYQNFEQKYLKDKDIFDKDINSNHIVQAGEKRDFCENRNHRNKRKLMLYLKLRNKNCQLN